MAKNRYIYEIYYSNDKKFHIEPRVIIYENNIYVYVKYPGNPRLFDIDKNDLYNEITDIDPSYFTDVINYDSYTRHKFFRTPIESQYEAVSDIIKEAYLKSINNKIESNRELLIRKNIVHEKEVKKLQGDIDKLEKEYEEIKSGSNISEKVKRV